MSDDPFYYAARATEERRLAMASESSKIRKIHLEMAARYAALADATNTPVREMVAEPEQKTA